MSIRLFGSALVAMMLAVTPALACTGKDIFTDDFNVAARGWPKFKGAAVGGGKAVLTPEPEKSMWFIYGGAFFDNADICVDVSVGQTRDPADTYGGLVFWHEDNTNYALFLISPSGAATIIRYQKGRKLAPVDWEDTELVATKPNAVNKLRLTLKGRTQVAYINGKSFAELTMQPPADGGKFGFEVASEKDSATSWAFSKLKITEPPR